MNMLELTAESALSTRTFRRAIKTAPVKIRALTEQDVRDLGPSYADVLKNEDKELTRVLAWRFHVPM